MVLKRLGRLLVGAIIAPCVMPNLSAGNVGIAEGAISAMENVVISIGRIDGGTKENVIADKAILKGTFRTKGPLIRESV